MSLFYSHIISLFNHCSFIIVISTIDDFVLVVVMVKVMLALLLVLLVLMVLYSGDHCLPRGQPH